jgi:putative ribosome biogenesis GTPase RsgA
MNPFKKAVTAISSKTKQKTKKPLVRSYVKDLVVGSYVNQKGTTHPTGMVKEIFQDGTVLVRWGVADGRTYEDFIFQTQLRVINHDVVSSDEVQRRQAKESGMPYKIEGE